MGSRFSVTRALNRWSPIHSETHKNNNMYAHSIDIVRWTGASIWSPQHNNIDVVYQAIDWASTDSGSHAEAAASTHTHTIENGSSNVRPFIFQYCTPAIFPLRARKKKKRKAKPLLLHFFSCFYELLNAKPLFGLINLLDAFRAGDVLRCCISVPRSLHRSNFGINSASGTDRCWLRVVYRWNESNKRTISTNSHRLGSRTSRITCTPMHVNINNSVSMISITFFLLLLLLTLAQQSLDW